MLRFGLEAAQDHQDKVAQLAERALNEAQEGEQVLQNRRVQGYESSRKPDVQIVDREGKARQIYEAERYPNSARNQTRQAEYEQLGIPHQTFPLGQ